MNESTMHLNASPSHPLRRRLLLATGALAAAALSGCSVFGGGGPAVLNAQVVASAQVNPDARKRPSPVVVRVFELKAPTQFEQADFISLFEKDQAVLGPEFISREEFVLRPGETKPVTKPLSPDTKFIGVMVAFRELERARWRAVVPVAAGKKNVMTIDLSDITVQAKRTSPKL
jgi:type VI secretion system protein VasD